MFAHVKRVLAFFLVFPFLLATIACSSKGTGQSVSLNPVASTMEESPRKASSVVENIAPLAVVTASNYWVINLPEYATDGDYYTFWRSQPGYFGGWITLTWPEKVTLNRIYICHKNYDPRSYPANQKVSVNYYTPEAGWSSLATYLSYTPGTAPYGDAIFFVDLPFAPIEATAISFSLLPYGSSWTGNVFVTEVQAYGTVGSSTPEITEIKIKDQDTGAFVEELSLEMSSLKGIKRFQAIGCSNGTGTNPIPVNWSLEYGDVNSGSIRDGILTKLDSNVGKIGVFSTLTGTASTVLNSETVTFVSFLSGNINLVAAATNGISKTIPIRLKQPTIYLDFKELDSVGPIAILSDWKSLASQIWNAEDLIAVKFRGAGTTNVPNQTFNPALPPTESLETLLPFFFGVPLPDLLDVIVFDYQADSRYGRSITYTRQLSELASRNRSTTNTDINVSVTKRLYCNGGMWEFPGGWTSTSDDVYKREMSPSKIDDLNESDIVLINPSYDSPGVFGLFKRSYLAHEIGHALMQYGDEHKWDGVPLPTDNLMSKASVDVKLTPSQFIHALGFNKPFPNRFLIEE